MVSNETWGGAIAMQLRYTVHCNPCKRIVEVDLAKMPPDDSAIGVKFRCTQCGRLGTVTVSHRSADRTYPGAKREA